MNWKIKGGLVPWLIVWGHPDHHRYRAWMWRGKLRSPARVIAVGPLGYHEIGSTKR